MLKREPSERANLEEILCHDWFQMEMETIPLPALPLISREHLSEEDHNYLVDKMVEGEIGTKEEVLKYVDTTRKYMGMMYMYMYHLLLTHLNLKKMCNIKPNLSVLVLIRCPFKIVSDSSVFSSKWHLLLKIAQIKTPLTALPSVQVDPCC